MSFTGIMQDLFRSNILNYQGEMIDWIIDIFENFLVSKKISTNTRKNYRSDVRNFLTWLVETRKISIQNQKFALHASDVCHMISLETVNEFKKDQTHKDTPIATVNRKLSSLRIFLDCAREQEWLTQNISASIKNIQTSKNVLNQEVLIQEFITYLQNEGASKGTIKNYAADVHDFLTWTKNQSTLVK